MHGFDDISHKVDVISNSECLSHKANSSFFKVVYAIVGSHEDVAQKPLFSNTVCWVVNFPNLYSALLSFKVIHEVIRIVDFKPMLINSTSNQHFKSWVGWISRASTLVA